MGNLVHNEQVKLFAAFLNNLGVAAFAGGAVLPVVTLSFADKPEVFMWLPPAIGGAIGTYCMWQAKKSLLRLKE